MTTRLLRLALAVWALEAVRSPATVLFVDVNCASPAPPYTNWVTAATNIQDAVDVAAAGDEIVVTDGVYAAGATAVYGMSNRVAVTQPVTVRSVNGPDVTTIVGYQDPSTTDGPAAIRCAYLTNGAVLAGFTLTNGATQTSSSGAPNQSGGGVWCESSNSIVTNCMLAGNSANDSGGGAYSGTLNNCTLSSNWATNYGGGAYKCTLNNCTLTNNSAANYGGGAYWCTLSNCTLTGNWAYYAGGACIGTLYNCTLTGNSAYEGGGACDSTLNNCVLTGNWATNYGGGAYSDYFLGAYSDTLNNCTLSGNWAYEGGGAYSAMLNNCTLTTNSASIGGGAFSGTLNNCMLVGNSASGGGGGACSATLNNCTLSANSASYAYGGGGAANCTLNNSTLTGNSNTAAVFCTLNNCMLTGNSGTFGGGAYGSKLCNCTVAGNSAFYAGGGVDNSSLTNCIVYYNTGPGGNYVTSGYYCCTTPLPSSGTGNFTNAPLFVDTNGWSNLRLQSNSPCINAGNNAYVTNTTDLDGNPRIVGGTVDVGAYECQSPALLDYYIWLQGYGLSTAASDLYADSDNDGMNNWQEWMAGTNPTNAASVLQLQPPQVTPPKVLLRWSSDTNHAYFVQRAMSLKVPLSFTTLSGNIQGLPSSTAYTDTTAVPSKGPVFYRIGTGSSNGPAALTLQRPELVSASTTLSWMSVTNRTYFVERAANLAPPVAFSLLQSNIAGLPGTTSFVDTNAPASGPAYYRVGVRP
jgi:hypothetical protein